MGIRRPDQQIFPGTLGHFVPLFIDKLNKKRELLFSNWRLAVGYWRPMPIKMGYKLKLPVFCLTYRLQGQAFANR
ncbi:MAG: hypothetical protein H6573_15515 [Lewinellaceae bacterium]|nr:hypothetical protein [Lewinellaceae bacterium]